ncbi:MAG: hypothetical protein ACREC6_08850 [Hyphomicrobiaceae bacterium]
MCLGVYIGSDKPFEVPDSGDKRGRVHFYPLTRHPPLLAILGTAHGADALPDGRCGCGFALDLNVTFYREPDASEWRIDWDDPETTQELSRRLVYVRELSEFVRKTARSGRCRLLLCWDGQWRKPAPAVTPASADEIVHNPHFFDGTEEAPKFFEFAAEA